MVKVSPAGLIYLYPGLFSTPYKLGSSLIKFNDPLKPGVYWSVSGLREKMILATILALTEDNKVFLVSKESKKLSRGEYYSKDSRVVEIVKNENFNSRIYGFISEPIEKLILKESISLRIVSKRAVQKVPKFTSFMAQVFKRDIEPLGLFKQEKRLGIIKRHVPVKEKMKGLRKEAEKLRKTVLRFRREEPEKYKIAVKNIIEGIVS